MKEIVLKPITKATSTYQGSSFAFESAGQAARETNIALFRRDQLVEQRLLSLELCVKDLIALIKERVIK